MTAARRLTKIQQLARQVVAAGFAQADLQFPDADEHRKDGSIHLITVEAMRKAKGDRRIACKILGITRTQLASRLYAIRKMQEALEDRK